MVNDLGQLYAEFLRECEFSAKLRSETLRGYTACFTLFAKIMDTIKHPSQLNPAVMTEFFTRLEKRDRIVGKGILKKGVKNSTVATYRNKLKKFFTWLRIRKYLKEDPFLGIPYPAVLYIDKKFLRREDVEKIFTALAFTIEWNNAFIKRRNLALFSVLLHCGLRKGELLCLKLLDIDFDHSELRVRAETSKSKIDRLVPISSKVKIAIKEYIEERRKRGSTTPYLWVSEVGDTRFTVNGFKHLNQKIAQISGVRFHPHQFRHTFAINMLNIGCDIYKLKQLLGHTDIRMTCAYLRCLPTKAMRDDVEKLSLDKLI